MSQSGASENLVEEEVMATGAIRGGSPEEVAFSLELKEWGEFPPFELRGRETLQQRQLHWIKSWGWEILGQVWEFGGLGWPRKK